MLKRRRRLHRGVSLVELLVAVTVLAFLLVMGAPGMRTWLQNARLRGQAESVVAGLQFAKTESVARNTRVRFQLTTPLTNTCVLSPAGTHWVVNLDPNNNVAEVEGKCDAAPSDTVSPFILQKHEAAEGSGGNEGAVVAADVSTVVFNGLGRLTPAPVGNVNIDVSNPASGDCAVAGGPMTCLRIVVSPAGQIRMCNPKFASPDPQAC